MGDTLHPSHIFTYSALDYLFLTLSKVDHISDTPAQPFCYRTLDVIGSARKKQLHYAILNDSHHHHHTRGDREAVGTFLFTPRFIQVFLRNLREQEL